jgi:hypothetical protein
MSLDPSLDRVQRCVYRRSSIVTACGKNDFGISIQFPSQPTLNGRLVQPINPPLSPASTQGVLVGQSLESKIDEVASKKIEEPSCQ